MTDDELRAFAVWYDMFVSNMPTDFELSDEEWTRVVREYREGCHAHEVSSAIAEGRDTYRGTKSR